MESSNNTHSNYVQLYKPLVIEPERFLKGYLEPIHDFTVRNTFRESTQKNNKEILYLPYAKAIELKNRLFPELMVDCVMNPLTGGYTFKEINNAGYFLKAFMHDGERRSPLIYYGVLDTTGQNLYPHQLAKYQEKLKREGKEYDDQAVAVSVQELNKNYYRAITKAIAIVTGIGLSLWTGDDLSEETIEEKTALIEKVKKVYDDLIDAGGEYEPLNISLVTGRSEIVSQGKQIAKKLKELKSNS